MMKETVTLYKIPKVWYVRVVRGPKGIFRVKIGKRGKGGRPLYLLPKAPLDLSCGTPFQKKVWRAICKIPRGETRSYKWLAKKAGYPKAVRAVANACGANPIPIIIPCHRVIRSDGTIGGFSGPAGLKKKLLRIEKKRSRSKLRFAP